MLTRPPPTPRHVQRKRSYGPMARARDVSRLKPRYLSFYIHLFYPTNVYLGYISYHCQARPRRQCRLTRADKGQHWSTTANSGPRMPTKAGKAAAREGGLETRNVSSPRYVFLSLFLKILSNYLPTGVPTQADEGQQQPTKANNSQLRPMNANESRQSSSKGRKRGLEMGNVLSPRYVSFYIHLFYPTNVYLGYLLLPTRLPLPGQIQHADDSQCRLTTADKGQRWPTTAHECQQRPAKQQQGGVSSRQFSFEVFVF